MQCRCGESVKDDMDKCPACDLAVADLIELAQEKASSFQEWIACGRYWAIRSKDAAMAECVDEAIACIAKPAEVLDAIAPICRTEQQTELVRYLLSTGENAVDGDTDGWEGISEALCGVAQLWVECCGDRDAALLAIKRAEGWSYADWIGDTFRGTRAALGDDSAVAGLQRMWDDMVNGSGPLLGMSVVAVQCALSLPRATPGAHDLIHEVVKWLTEGNGMQPSWDEEDEAAAVELARVAYCELHDAAMADAILSDALDEYILEGEENADERRARITALKDQLALEPDKVKWPPYSYDV